MSTIEGPDNTNPSEANLDLARESAIQLGLEMEKILSISKEVVEELRRKNLCITTVESCTGGGVANSITDIPGASDVMKDAFVTYSNEAK